MDQLEGIVIRLYPSGEANFVARILTKEAGKLSVVARGARKSKAKFGSAIDLFDRGRVQLKMTKGSLPVIESFIPERPLKKLRQDLERMTAASVLCECFDLMVHEHAEECEETYDLLSLGLDAIETGTSSKESLKGCFLTICHLLTLTGYGGGSETEAAPSAKHLLELLSLVERCSEREVTSRSALAMILGGLREVRA